VSDAKVAVVSLASVTLRFMTSGSPCRSRVCDDAAVSEPCVVAALAVDVAP
jgi:hypothetical protein